MVAKRKTGHAAKVAGNKKSAVKAVRKTTTRKGSAHKPASATKHPAAKRKAVRKTKSTIQKAEAAVVEMAKGIVPKARKVIRSVGRSISGKK